MQIHTYLDSMCAWFFKNGSVCIVNFKACPNHGVCTHIQTHLIHAHSRWNLLDSSVTLLGFICLHPHHFCPLDKGNRCHNWCFLWEWACISLCTGRLFVWLLNFLSCHRLLSDAHAPADTGALCAHVFSPSIQLAVYSIPPYRRLDITFAVRPNISSLGTA